MSVGELVSKMHEKNVIGFNAIERYTQSRRRQLYRNIALSHWGIFIVEQKRNSTST
jgi:hypothetical protein